ncbi:TetR-like C-terminal domain-containing protein [Actinomyces faecalis]|uniref:TetR-like C-terminal domain-containing protein n=1 Tax=Actinomyces faecalis TaxID=2722820 RepID=UPI0015558A0A|nr:TetR-like C-terminal domain-containing protein [Actinomyces faecalis]
MTTTAERTRLALGQALKDELETTPLNRVTVRRLSEVTGITRQAFYYHFADVYDLAVWTFMQEVTHRVMAAASYARWAEGLELLMVWMAEHKAQAYQTLQALSHEDLERFLHGQLRAMMVVIVSELEQAYPVRLSEQDRAFIIDHYTLSVLGHLLHWLVTGMEQDPHVLVPRIERVLRGSVWQSLTRFSAERG